MTSTAKTYPDSGNPSMHPLHKSLTLASVIRIKMHARHIRKNLEVRRASRRVIFPNSKPKILWDFLNFLLLMYSVFEIPYAISFLPSDCNVSWPEILNLSIDCFFLSDFLVNFFTAFKDDEIGNFEVRLTEIAKHYLKGWMFIDLVSSLPMDRIVCSLQDGNSGNAVRFAKIVRIVKVLRILRMIRLAARLEEAIGAFASKSIQLAKFLVFLLLCGHVCACAWHLLIQINNCSIPADEIPNMVVTCGCASEDCQDYNWLARYDPTVYAGEDPTARYLISVYYSAVTLTTLGYGDVVPTNQVRAAARAAPLGARLCISRGHTRPTRQRQPVGMHVCIYVVGSGPPPWSWVPRTPPWEAPPRPRQSRAKHPMARIFLWREASHGARHHMDGSRAIAPAPFGHAATGTGPAERWRRPPPALLRTAAARRSGAMAESMRHEPFVARAGRRRRRSVTRGGAGGARRVVGARHPRRRALLLPHRQHQPPRLQGQRRPGGFISRCRCRCRCRCR